ncbi:MAG: hypothetical protein ACP5H3_02310 [Candidatus Aenigmatarchaeota archaeon]|jgi:DNA-directed RNA polymerase subunit F
MEIIDEKPITFAEAKEILESKSKKELKYEQANALEHLKKFTKLSLKEEEKLKEELRKISKLNENHIVLICNFLPTTKDELRAVLYKDYNSFEEAELNSIIEIVKKFA